MLELGIGVVEEVKLVTNWLVVSGLEVSGLEASGLEVSGPEDVEWSRRCHMCR